MKLHLIKVDGDPIIWAHKSQKATVANFVSIMGILPFVFLLVFPYGIVFQCALINFGLDIYRTRKRANRWVDMLRRFRFMLNGGHWKVQSRQKLRQRMWAWDHTRGRRY